MEAKARPTRLDDWGLIVVDMQNDFLSAGGYYARRNALDQQIGQPPMTDETRNRLLSRPGAAPPGGFTYRADSLPRLVANVIAIIAHARTQDRPIAYLQAVYGREFDVQPPFLRQDLDREHYPCKPQSWGTALIEPIHRLAAGSRAASREKTITKHTFDGFHQTELLRFLRDRDVQTVVVVGVETHVCVLTTAQSASINRFKTLILEDCVWTAHEALGQAALSIFRDAFGSTAQCDSDLWRALGRQ